MNAPIFDSLAYAKKLEEAGFTRDQAEIQANSRREQAEELWRQSEKHAAALHSALQNYDDSQRRALATKADLHETRADLKEDIANVRSELQGVRADLKEDIANVRSELQAVRTELKEDIANVRSELQTVRTELKEDIANVRSELQGVRADLKEDINSVRSELKEDINSVRSELKEDIANVRTEMKEAHILLSDKISQQGTRIILWVVGMMGVMFAVMAKGFGWVGF